MQLGNGAHVTDQCVVLTTADGQRLLEDVGPRLSLQSLMGGGATFQSYLETCSAQAGMLANGTLDKQARRVLR